MVWAPPPERRQHLPEDAASIRTRPAGIKGSCHTGTRGCPPDPLNQLVRSLLGTLAMGDRAVGNREGKGILSSWCQGLTDMAGLPQERRRTLAGVVAVQV